MTSTVKPTSTLSRYWSTCFSRAHDTTLCAKSRPLMEPCRWAGSMRRRQHRARDGACLRGSGDVSIRRSEAPCKGILSAAAAHLVLPIIIVKLQPQQLLSKVADELPEGRLQELGAQNAAD